MSSLTGFLIYNMTFRNYLGIFGALMVIAGVFSPMLHIPIIGNWNYWDIEPVLAALVLVMAALGMAVATFGKPALLRFGGWGVLIVVLFTLLAVYFKVNDYFSFIPFKKLAAAAAGIVRYRWLGWVLLVSGAVIMVLSSRNTSIGISAKH